MKYCTTNISVTLIGMPKHYHLPEGTTQGEMYQVHFWHSSWFLNELGPCFSKCGLRPSLTGFVCASSQKPASECAWMAMGRKWTLFELGAVQTQTVHGSLCETERRRNDPLALQTLPAVQSQVPMCVCAACARVRALVPVHSCGQIQIWGHTLSQCSLFNFHRYVNSNAKACIWCIRKVYPKGEES